MKKIILTASYVGLAAISSLSGAGMMDAHIIAHATTLLSLVFAIDCAKGA